MASAPSSPPDTITTAATTTTTPSINFGEVPAVDVTAAEARYAELGRHTRPPSPTSVEAAIAAPAAPFDLADFLRHRVREQQERGIHPKRLGLTFRHLSVWGNPTARAHIQTFWSPFYRILYQVGACLRVVPRNPVPEPTQLLHDLTGMCADGEMLLVLGKPGSGCSTLLRVLANQRRTYSKITGEVEYNGMPASEMHPYRGEIAYNQEDDQHYPTLTVKNTLEFVCKCRTPSQERLTDERGFMQLMVDITCTVFGLTHCKHTKVGNEYVRGVSGGERKRMSIAEQVIALPAVGIWDGSTKGLDASTALDFVRALRIATDTIHRTTLATFYQASEDIYQLFDRVLVLDGGRCLYFGPASAAKAYFESLGLVCPPRMTTPDFLTGVTQLDERVIQPGYEGTVPNTAAEFADRFTASAAYADTEEAIKTFHAQLCRERPDRVFRAAVSQAKTRGISVRSPYMVSYWMQLKACLAREFHLMYGARFDILAHIGINTLLAVILGWLFYKLPLDSSGAYTRGGIIFVSVLFNVLSAQAELPKSFQGRGVLYKHKRLALYYPSAFYIAQVVADMPRLLVSILLYTLVLYWMVGLHSAADTFFIFVLGIFLMALAMTALFRLIGAVSPNLPLANIISGIVLVSFILYSGYLIPLRSMRGWFIWLRYANPLSWGLDALIINEYRRLTFACTPPFLLPSGPGYNQLRFQTCSIPGGQQASAQVSGLAYIAANYSSREVMLWPNIAIVAGFWLVYVLLSCLAMELLEFGKGGYSTNVYKSHISTRNRRIGLERAVKTPGAASPKESDAQLQQLGMQHRVDEMPIFFWNRVSYTVPFKTDPGGKRRLLNQVCGWVRTGELVALMGSSGAGKTTLLDVLAQRKAVGTVSGSIRLQQQIPGRDFRLNTGYCEQMDVHNPFATVRETLRFSAYLRRPAHVSVAEKNAEVDRVIAMLELPSIAHALIGSLETGLGISPEERKRVTIAMELVAKPTILFLDEPTSGLDAQASYMIVSLLRRLADNGQAIICTIHQPSAILFESFDKLLLLARGGQTVYFGRIGEDARILIRYFERNGAPACPPTANPAEYILDAVGAGVTGGGSAAAADWPSIWRASPEAQAVQRAIDGYDRVAKRTPPRTDRPLTYQTRLPQQSSIVARRMILNYWRMPAYNLGRLVNQTLVALLLGFSFYRLGYSKEQLSNRSFAIFQTTVLSVLIMNDVMPAFIAQRALFLRETSAGYYSWWVFTTAMIIAELPYLLLVSTVFFVLNYWLTNYNPDSGRAIYFYVFYVVYIVYAAMLGQAVAALSPNLMIAMLISPFLSAIMGNFAGVVIPGPQMPTFWYRWLYWIDPYHYVIEGLLVNDLQGKTTYCVSGEFNLLQPPPGLTCGAYMRAYLARSTGYIDNPAASADCRYCQYRTGDEFYDTFNFSFAHRWRNFLIIIGLTVFNVALIYLFMSRFRTRPQRITKIQEQPEKPSDADSNVQPPSSRDSTSST